jgi:predicted acylesterase/phospholipase RssA
MEANFDIVILSGGGIKGLAQLGVLHYYVEKGMLDIDKISVYSGTSAGSIIALLLCCGYQPIDLLAEMYKISSIFRVSDIPNVWSLAANYGLMSISHFKKIVGDLVIAKLGKIPTMMELKTLKNKTIIVSAVNITKSRVEYFSYKTRPNLNVVDAVMMSCNLPFIFEKLSFDGDYYIDGGLADNFPIDALSDEEKKKSILGVIVTGSEATAPRGGGGTQPDMSFFDYMYRIIVLPITVATHLRARDVGDNVKLIKMNLNGIPVLGFAMDVQAKIDLFMKGYYEAQIYDHKELLYIEGYSKPLEQDGWNVEFEF